MGEKIKKLRMRNNLSQMELAEILGVSQPMVAQYEKNIKTPNLKMLNKIADYFKVSLDYLAGRIN